MTNKNLVNLSGDAKDIAAWIWYNLVPKTGQAATVQGELLRAVEKLSWEAQNNGNINWDTHFELFVSYLEETLTSESRFTPTLRQLLRADLARLRKFKAPYVADDLYERLTDAVVAFCRLNPQLIEKPFDAKQPR